MNKGTNKNRSKNGLNKSTLDQGLQEQGFHLPPPWQVFSSLQVADALGLSLNTMSNMKLRRTGPPPEPFEDYRGNRIMYRYDRLCEWLTGLPAWKFHQQWLAQTHSSLPRETKEQCYDTSKYVIESRLYRQPKWRRKWKAGPIKAFGGA